MWIWVWYTNNLEFAGEEMMHSWFINRALKPTIGMFYVNSKNAVEKAAFQWARLKRVSAFKAAKIF